MMLTSLEPNCHFCYFANGLTVSNFLLHFKKPLFFVEIDRYGYFEADTNISADIDISKLLNPVFCFIKNVVKDGEQ